MLHNTTKQQGHKENGRCMIVWVKEPAALDSDVQRFLTDYTHTPTLPNYPPQHASETITAVNVETDMLTATDSSTRLQLTETGSDVVQQVLRNGAIVGARLKHAVETSLSPVAAGIPVDVVRAELTYHLLKRLKRQLSASGIPDRHTVSELRKLGWEGSVATVHADYQQVSVQRRGNLEGVGELHAPYRDAFVNVLTTVLREEGTVTDGRVEPIVVQHDGGETLLSKRGVLPIVPDAWLDADCDGSPMRVVADGSRPRYTPAEPSKGAVLTVDSVGNVRGLVHEYGHRFEECVPMLNVACRAFLAYRYNGVLSMPSGNEGENAVWCCGGGAGFTVPYAARLYPDSVSTEVLSVGLETLLSGGFGGLIGAGLYQPDFGHYHWVLGLLASRIS